MGAASIPEQPPAGLTTVGMNPVETNTTGKNPFHTDFDARRGVEGEHPVPKTFEMLIKETFDIFDVNSDGKLDAEEIEEVEQRVGFRE